MWTSTLQFNHFPWTDIYMWTSALQSFTMNRYENKCSATIYHEQTHQHALFRSTIYHEHIWTSALQPFTINICEQVLCNHLPWTDTSTSDLQPFKIDRHVNKCSSVQKFTMNTHEHRSSVHNIPSTHTHTHTHTHLPLCAQVHATADCPAIHTLRAHSWVSRSEQ